MSRIYGVVTGTVVGVEDPNGEGRVRVRLPWMSDSDEQGYWAPVATLMAGSGRGTWFRPEDGDEVLLAFFQGKENHPYVVGHLWNGKDKPPSDNRQLRLIHTVNGHEIAIYDPDISGGDTGYIRIKDANGNRVELSNAMITIESVGTIQINAPNVIINGRPVAPQPRPI